MNRVFKGVVGGFVCAVLVLGAKVALAQSDFYAGSYNGTGEWKRISGESGKYQVQTVVKKDGDRTRIETTYRFDQVEKHWNFSIDMNKNGSFKVWSNDYPIGSGYCLNRRCHYSIRGGEFFLEESLAFYGVELHKHGSKGEGSMQSFWTESLIETRANE